MALLLALLLGELFGLAGPCCLAAQATYATDGGIELAELQEQLHFQLELQLEAGLSRPIASPSNSRAHEELCKLALIASRYY